MVGTHEAHELSGGKKLPFMRMKRCDPRAFAGKYRLIGPACSVPRCQVLAAAEELATEVKLPAMFDGTADIAHHPFAKRRVLAVLPDRNG